METLRRLRAERGLSQARLAARAELDPSTVNQIERGAREASPATLRKLADALDVGIADLLEETSPKGPRRSSPEPSFNDVLESERRRSELEEIRESYRATREGLGRYCDVWERRIAADDLDRESVRSFLEAADALLPAATDSAVSELIGISSVVDHAEGDSVSDEALAEASVKPVVDRYHAIGRRLQEVWREKFAANAGASGTGKLIEVDFRALQAEDEVRKRRTG